MTYRSILTSKGTATVPKEVRDQLGIAPGMYVAFFKIESGDYVIRRAQTIAELRAMNKQALQQASTQDRTYESGQGFEAAVEAKFEGGR